MQLPQADASSCLLCLGNWLTSPSPICGLAQTWTGHISTAILLFAASCVLNLLPVGSFWILFKLCMEQNIKMSDILANSSPSGGNDANAASPRDPPEHWPGHPSNQVYTGGNNGATNNTDADLPEQ